MGNLREATNGTRNNGDEREGRERRRRKAIEALESLLTRLRGWCQTLERLDQWYELLQEVRQVFTDWEDALPRKARKRLERALGRAGRVKENLDLACKALQDDFQATIQAARAPKPGFPLKAVVIGTAATAVVGVGIAAAVIVPPLLREWVTVTVHNNCPNVLEYDASGIEPPQGEIAPFSTQSFEVPAVEASVRRDLVGIEVSALGREFRIPVAPNVMLRLNDRSIPPDFEGSIDLQGREEHQLVMTCP